MERILKTGKHEKMGQKSEESNDEVRQMSPPNKKTSVLCSASCFMLHHDMGREETNDSPNQNFID